MKSSLCLLLCLLIDMFSFATAIPHGSNSETRPIMRKRLRKRAVCPPKQIPISGNSPSTTRIQSTPKGNGKVTSTVTPPSAPSATQSKTGSPNANNQPTNNNNQPKLSSKKGFGFTQGDQLAAFGNSLGWCFDWLATPFGTVPNGINCKPSLNRKERV